MSKCKFFARMATLLLMGALPLHTVCAADDSTPPVLIASNPQDTVIIGTSDSPTVMQMVVSATNLSKPLNEYMAEGSGKASDDKQGQCFYLEGGKTYFLRENVAISRGFTLKTNPADIAAGKGRAKVCLGGVNKIKIVSGNDGSVTYQVATSIFLLGAQRSSLGNFPNAIDDVVFEDIDFDCPLAQRYTSGGPSSTGNYFINMWSNHVPLTVDNLTMRDCSFQGILRGFFRVQGQNTLIENILMEGCETYNCGQYDNNGGGYSYFFLDSNVNSATGTSVVHNLAIRNNTFFDSPKGSLITDNNRNIDYADKINVTIENNTFVNFCTRSTRNAFINFRYLPKGSTVAIKSNLFVLTKQAGDQRSLYFSGSDVRNLQGACTDNTTFDIGNNWSTNDNLTNGQVFTQKAFSASRNSFGSFANNATVEYPQGTAELEVHVAAISAVDLMCQPNPPHPMADATVLEENTHCADAIDGTGKASANLYFKNFDNDIVRHNVGASKWRMNGGSGVKAVTELKRADGAVYTLSGLKVSNPQHGVYIKDGKKYVK